MAGQELNAVAETPEKGVAGVRFDNATMECHRRWLHRVFWLGFFVTVFMTKRSIDNPSMETIVHGAAFVLVTAATVGRLWCTLYLRGRKSKQLCHGLLR